jgi:hypothetical protein
MRRRAADDYGWATAPDRVLEARRRWLQMWLRDVLDYKQGCPHREAALQERRALSLELLRRARDLSRRRAASDAAQGAS